MVLRRPGDTPLIEPMMVYPRIYASLGLNELTISFIRTESYSFCPIVLSVLNILQHYFKRNETCAVGSDIGFKTNERSKPYNIVLISCMYTNTRTNMYMGKIIFNVQLDTAVINRLPVDRRFLQALAIRIFLFVEANTRNARHVLARAPVIDCWRVVPRNSSYVTQKQKQLVSGVTLS